MKMNPQRIVQLLMLSAGAMLCASCASMSQEQIIANQQSRLQQQEKGYFDRESGAQQKKADERAQQEKLREKS
jgi:uncharacterized lipoprotein YajG